MSEIHYIKDARNQKSTFDLRWAIGSCNVKLLYSHNHKPKDCKTVDFANFGDFN